MATTLHESAGIFSQYPMIPYQYPAQQDGEGDCKHRFVAQKTDHGAVQAHAHENRSADDNHGRIGGPIGEKERGFPCLEGQSSPQRQAASSLNPCKSL